MMPTQMTPSVGFRHGKWPPLDLSPQAQAHCPVAAPAQTLCSGQPASFSLGHYLQYISVII